MRGQARQDPAPVPGFPGRQPRLGRSRQPPIGGTEGVVEVTPPHSDRAPRRQTPVIIVGGGLAGLACAHRFAEAGVEFLLVEASDELGGRVRTDEQDGFLLDRGFQVFLSAYPEAGRRLDLEALDLRRFKPGALVFTKGRRHRLMDVFRAPRHALSTALQPIGSVRDKLRVGKLRWEMLRKPVEAIEAGEDLTTAEYLRKRGFSEAMIDRFFRPFYGGIFLERDLRTSSRMFEFTFKMFARGFASIPEKGMQEIPRQLAARLPAGSCRLNTPVRAVQQTGVTLADGERLAAESVVVATDAGAAGELLPGGPEEERAWRSVAGLYFSAPRSPLNEAIIALNGDDGGLVNNVCALSDVAPGYAPEGRALISVSVPGLPDFPDLAERVRAELRSWFGGEVDQWSHLRTDRIRRALPEQSPALSPAESAGYRVHDGVFVCGDHCTSASIEGALVSGRRAAEAVLETRKGNSSGRPA
ncbi:MAG: NAD(P)-binding protein [Akkermansiaceae bacterium]|nr:NAD(P)-binding protein [Akkermansiaceae bacterium]